MLLSEMFGVERDTDFGVKGYESTFKLTLNGDGAECLLVKWSGGIEWRLAQQETLCAVILRAPANIIHLPPPLTDEQREQLRHIYGLGGRWLAKDSYGDNVFFAFVNKPYKKDGGYWWSDIGGRFMVLPSLCVCKLVSSSDPEPFDIGKALRYENKNNT